MDLKLKAYVYLGNKVLPRADGIAPLSSALLEDLPKNGAPSDRTRLIPNAADLVEVEQAPSWSRSSLGLDGGHFRGLHWSTHPEKAH